MLSSSDISLLIINSSLCFSESVSGYDSKPESYLIHWFLVFLQTAFFLSRCYDRVAMTYVRVVLTLRFQRCFHDVTSGFTLGFQMLFFTSESQRRLSVYHTAIEAIKYQWEFLSIQT